MKHTYRIGHLFCGLGGFAIGTRMSRAFHDGHEAEFVTVGGVDLDPDACTDFERLTGAPATCRDLHEMTPAELRLALGAECPDVIAMSPPCKGFSGLLSAKRAEEEKYQVMNRLMLDAIFLVCSTWAAPPSCIFIENVPRISYRGKHLIDQVEQTLHAHGYLVHKGTHDCGELGGLAQRRKRWFLVARQPDRLPHQVYHPIKQRVRACGEVLGPLPMPGDTDAAGPMHSVPALSWRNWKRLSLIPAGGDWRDLPGVVAPGKKKRSKHRKKKVTAWSEAWPTVSGPGGNAAENVSDPRAPWFNGILHVDGWDKPASCVTGNGRVSGSGASAVADPRFGNVDRVTAWDRESGTVTGSGRAPSSGGLAVADPRTWEANRGHLLGLTANPGRHFNKYQVLAWDRRASTVIGATRPGSGAPAVADPRFAQGKKKNWQRVSGVTSWKGEFPTVTSNASLHAGAFAVDDPRVGDVDVSVGLGASGRWLPGRGSGHYRVIHWEEACPAITGSVRVDNGAGSVADPRVTAELALIGDTARLPHKRRRWIPIIIAEDGTWHRPVTTYELAALQSLPLSLDGKPLVLTGASHTKWRERIGNAVPPDAGKAVGDQLLQSLLLSTLGTYVIGATPVWVEPDIRPEALQ